MTVTFKALARPTRSPWKPTDPIIRRLYKAVTITWALVYWTLVFILGPCAFVLIMFSVSLTFDIHRVLGSAILNSASKLDYGSPLLAVGVGIAGGLTWIPIFTFIPFIGLFNTNRTKLAVSIFLGPALGTASGGAGSAILREFWSEWIEDVTDAQYAAVGAVGGAFLGPFWYTVLRLYREWRHDRKLSPAERVARIELVSEAASMSLWDRSSMRLGLAKQVRYYNGHSRQHREDIGHGRMVC